MYILMFVDIRTLSNLQKYCGISSCLPCVHVLLACSDATLRDLESGMARLREAEEAAGANAEHTREEVC